MIKKYSASLLATAIAGLLSVQASAQDSLQVVDLGSATNAYETFPGGMNDIGEAVVINRNLWQQNIRVDLLDPESFPEELDLNDMSDAEYRVVRNWLLNVNSRGSNPLFQKLGTQVSHIFDGQARDLDGFDRIDPDTNRMSDSVDVLANDINSKRVIVGRASEPYAMRPSTDRKGDTVDYFIRESFPRAFAKVNDQVIFLEASEGVYQGGTGNALAVNDNNQVVGTAAVAQTTGLGRRFDLCQEIPDDDTEESLAREELTVCIWRYWVNNEVSSSSRSPIFVEQAHQWDLDDDGNITDIRLLGSYPPYVPEPEEGDEEDEPVTPQLLRSVAYDINNSGVAVGSAYRYVTSAFGAENVLVNTSVIYQDGEIIDLQSRYENQMSEATAINDNGIVVGYTNAAFNFTNRNRAYYVDINESERELIFPRGFFPSSGWRPRAINNNNVMVGRAEPTATVTSQRPTVGFMYDINSDTMTDLNSLLACDSGYRIVDAYDINDAGEIMALATTSIAINVDGNEEVSERLRAVRLQPGNGPVCEEQPELESERQGASVTPIWAGFLALFTFLITRRRLKAR